VNSLKEHKPKQKRKSYRGGLINLSKRNARRAVAKVPKACA
jgi:hypothetical protein